MDMDTSPLLVSLYAKGLSANREPYEKSFSMSVDDEEVANNVTGFGVAISWTLPDEAPFSAAFGKEGIQHKVVKMFKREIQTKDDAFDDLVYISTDNKKKTAKFLEDSGVRDAVRQIVSADGSVSIEENEVIFDIATDSKDHPGTDPKLMAVILEALLNA